MKRILLIGSLLIFSLIGKAQYTREDAPPPQTMAPAQSSTTPTTESPFWSRVSIGGGFGPQFGDPTLVGLSPLFNYFIIKDVEIGIGPMYQYFRIYDQFGNSYTSTSYGGRISASIFLP